MQGSYGPLSGFRRLRPLFREANRRANEVIKVLRHPRWKKAGLTGSKDYALGLALLVRTLARQGVKASASQANDLADQVELMLDLLHVEMSDLLKS
jgi:hypothetical protein